MKYTQIPVSTFKELQMNAGMLLTQFDPETGDFENENIIGATSGGAKFNAAPTFSDFGDDIDNCPKNMKELKNLDSWEVTMDGTFITTNTKMCKRLISAADVDPEDPNHIIPRNDVLLTDYQDLWWVGDFGANGSADGGFLAIHLFDALSTGGFQLQSGDKAKGQFPFTFTGHYSMDNQSRVPFELYLKEKTEGVQGDEEDEP